MAKFWRAIALLCATGVVLHHTRVLGDTAPYSDDQLLQIARKFERYITQAPLIAKPQTEQVKPK